MPKMIFEIVSKLFFHKVRKTGNTETRKGVVGYDSTSFVAL
jgi:hypothetical protein